MAVYAAPLIAFSAIFSSLLFLCSGFYWYELGAISAQNSAVIDQQFTSIDIAHASIFVVAGVLGIVASFKVGFPASTLTGVLLFFCVAAGLTVEIALTFTLYSCASFYSTLASTGRFFSTTQFILCTNGRGPVGPWFAYMTLIIPLVVSWFAFAFLLALLIAWAKVDKYYFTYK